MLFLSRVIEMWIALSQPSIVCKNSRRHKLKYWKCLLQIGYFIISVNVSFPFRSVCNFFSFCFFSFFFFNSIRLWICCCVFFFNSCFILCVCESDYNLYISRSLFHSLTYAQSLAYIVCMYVYLIFTCTLRVFRRTLLLIVLLLIVLLLLFVLQLAIVVAGCWFFFCYSFVFNFQWEQFFSHIILDMFTHRGLNKSFLYYILFEPCTFVLVCACQFFAETKKNEFIFDWISGIYISRVVDVSYYLNFFSASVLFSLSCSKNKNRKYCCLFHPIIINNHRKVRQLSEAKKKITWTINKTVRWNCLCW